MNTDTCGGQKKGVRPVGTGITGGCELSEVDAGNWTQPVLFLSHWKHHSSQSLSEFNKILINRPSEKLNRRNPHRVTKNQSFQTTLMSSLAHALVPWTEGSFKQAQHILTSKGLNCTNHGSPWVRRGDLASMTVA